MTGCAVDVETPPARRDAVAAWLVARTGQALEERADGTLVGFLESPERFVRLREDLRAAFGPEVEAHRRPLATVDWSEQWRAGLGPRRFGRLVVRPSWLAAPSLDDGEVTLVLDPEMAFGSGEHGSTRAALRLLERSLPNAATVLDLGSGSGILAIAAALLGANWATGVELDDEAVAIAERNAHRNAVADRVRFLAGDAGLLAPLLAPVDLVVSNILRTVNTALLAPIHAALRPGGFAIFSGMEASEAALFHPPLVAAGFEEVAELEDDGWWAIATRRQ